MATEADEQRLILSMHSSTAIFSRKSLSGQHHLVSDEPGEHQQQRYRFGSIRLSAHVTGSFTTMTMQLSASESSASGKHRFALTLAHL